MFDNLVFFIHHLQQCSQWEYIINVYISSKSIDEIIQNLFQIENQSLHV